MLTLLLLFIGVLFADSFHLKAHPTDCTPKTLLFETDVIQNSEQRKAVHNRLTLTLNAAFSGLHAFSEGKLHQLDPQVCDNKCQLRASILCSLAKSGFSSRNILQLGTQLKLIQDAVTKLPNIQSPQRKLSLTQLIESALKKPLAEIITAEDEHLIKLFAATHGMEQSVNTLSHLQPKPTTEDNEATSKLSNKLQEAMKNFLIDASEEHLKKLAKQSMLYQPDTAKLATFKTIIAEQAVEPQKPSTQARNKPQSTYTFLDGLTLMFNNALHNNVPIVLQQYSCENNDTPEVQCTRALFAPHENRFKYLEMNEIDHLLETCSLTPSSAALVIEDDEAIYDIKNKKYHSLQLCDHLEYHEHEIFKNPSFDPLLLILQNALGHEANISRTAQREISAITLGIPFCTTHIYATTLRHVLKKNNELYHQGIKS
ncbi:hypothetical protein KJZ61_03620 [Candidatus Dependentiae bacterium]|nr:hypothetical protein [Candidatus Dependentiae bacterium]